MSDFHPTERLNLDQLNPNWPVVLAALERITPMGPEILRLGMVAMLEKLAREMRRPDAPAELIIAARDVVEWLAKMPWER